MAEALFIPAYGAALAACAWAAWRHRRDVARWRGSLAALVWTAGSGLRAEFAANVQLLALFGLDVLMVGFLVGLAWKARHGWPLLAACAQSLAAAALLAGLTDSRLPAAMPMSVATAATHLTALVLLAGAWLSSPSGGQRLGGQRHAAREAVTPVSDRLAAAPDGVRPGLVGLGPANDMHVQLSNDVAERADVQLVQRTEPPNGSPREDDLLDERRAFGRVEIVEFAELCAPRNEHEPRPARIVLEPHLAERQVGDERARCFQPWVERKDHERLGIAAQ